MKKIFLILFLLSMGFMLMAQVPQGVNYQSIIRDSNGVPMTKQLIDIQFSILDTANMIEYQEEHISIQTDAFGRVALTIGEGNSLNGDFESIRWSEGNKFLKVEVASQTGDTLKDLGTEKLKATFYALQAAQSDDWVHVGDNDIYHLKGRVGIGNSSPTERFVVGNDIGNVTGSPTAIVIGNQNKGSFSKLVMGEDSANWGAMMWRNTNTSSRPERFMFGIMKNGTLSDGLLTISNPNVGVGIKSPLAFLHVNGSGTIALKNKEKAWFRIGNELVMDPNEIGFFGTHGNIYTVGAYDLRFQTDGIDRMEIDKNGRVGIGTTAPKSLLDVNGEVTSKCLTIKGGCDIVEYKWNAYQQTLEPGDVLIIDPSNPANVMLSQQPYDKKVIGVYSGANGIRPGLSLSQTGMMEGDIPIAIAGQVYVKVTGKIEVGDLLTTSNTPGKAQVAKKFRKAQSTIIGKALSTPNEKGQVLMLVGRH